MYCNSCPLIPQLLSFLIRRLSVWLLAHRGSIECKSTTVEAARNQLRSATDYNGKTYLYPQKLAILTVCSNHAHNLPQYSGGFKLNPSFLDPTQILHSTKEWQGLVSALEAAGVEVLTAEAQGLPDAWFVVSRDLWSIAFLPPQPWEHDFFWGMLLLSPNVLGWCIFHPFFCRSCIKNKYK